MKVKVISLLYIFQVLYVLCFTNVKISGERLQDQWSSGCYCDSWITIIARSFKLGQLIEDDEYNMWCSFEKKLFYIFEVIAFREKHFVGGIMFHKHYF